eukprot:contig_14947_g3595
MWDLFNYLKRKRGRLSWSICAGIMFAANALSLPPVDGRIPGDERSCPTRPHRAVLIPLHPVVQCSSFTLPVRLR